MIKYLKNNIIQLPVLFIAAYFLSKYADLGVLKLFFTISALFLDLIGLLIPILVFVYLFSTILNVGEKALNFLITVFSLAIVSNMLTVLYTFCLSHLFLPFILMKSIVVYNSKDPLTPFLAFPFSGTSYLTIAMGSAIISALCFLLYADNNLNKKLTDFCEITKGSVTYIFSILVLYAFPLYIFGFLIKIFYEGHIFSIYDSILTVFLLYLLFSSLYIIIWYLISCKYSAICFSKSLKNMLPAGSAGFLTMSSAVALPLTVASIQNTLNEQKTAYLVAPTSVNIHLIGDNIFVILTTFTILILNNLSLPSFVESFPFLFIYNIAMLAAAGIPGGNVLVIVAILQEYMSFTPEMSKLFIILYILQDPFLTLFNILGNGAFAIFFKGLLNRFPYLINVKKST